MGRKVELVLTVPEYISSDREVWFSGADVEDVLHELFMWAFFEMDFTEIEGCTFQIEGDERLFEFEGTAFNYCFGKGRASVEWLLDALCYEG